MYIEVGPVGMSIDAKRYGVPFEFERKRVEGILNSILGDLAESLPVLKQRAHRIINTKGLPEIPCKMVEAVKIVDEKTLTPMAAVAGAVADGLKERLKEDGIDFIAINNGGDISIFNGSKKAIRVGLIEIKRGNPSPFILKIEGFKDVGIATSGFGGKSFTLGLADMATVIAKTGAIADAAATFICNMTNVGSTRVLRKRAIEIDPITDIPDDFVTVEIGSLTDKEKEEALRNGLSWAERLKTYGVIYDAIIILDNSMVTTIDGKCDIKLEVQDGDKKNSHYS
ncbi:MAG: hypothetical protein N2745_03185 [Syntrophorhabdaceae bacterium]|nr:hypothetical protein [Syntrophorhabdaceae bacterium]